MDLFFLFDLVLNFNTAVKSRRGVWYLRRRDIAKLYMKGYFVLDFSSCIPFDMVGFFVKSGASNKIFGLRLTSEPVGVSAKSVKTPS